MMLQKSDLHDRYGCGCQNCFGIPFWLVGEVTTHSSLFGWDWDVHWANGQMSFWLSHGSVLYWFPHQGSWFWFAEMNHLPCLAKVKGLYNRFVCGFFGKLSLWLTVCHFLNFCDTAAHF